MHRVSHLSSSPRRGFSLHPATGSRCWSRGWCSSAPCQGRRTRPESCTRMMSCAHWRRARAAAMGEGGAPPTAARASSLSTGSRAWTRGKGVTAGSVWGRSRAWLAALSVGCASTGCVSATSLTSAWTAAPAGRCPSLEGTCPGRAFSFTICRQARSRSSGALRPGAYCGPRASASRVPRRHGRPRGAAAQHA